MKINPIYLFLALITFTAAFLWVTSCRHNADISNLPAVCFERDVLPVFQNNCAISGCHSGQGESRKSLSNYADIVRQVVPGKPFSSKLYNAITGSGENLMPPGRPLSFENRTLIRVWIEQGAAQTTCTDTTGGSGSQVVLRACFSRDILPVLVSKCGSLGCHDATTHRAGYYFTSYSTVMNAVTAGSPGQSTIYRVITSSGEEKMPPSTSPQLTVAEIDSIGKWIGYGALNQTCGEVCDTISPVTFSGIIWPAIQTACIGCHSGTTPSGSVSLTSYSDVSSLAASGLLIKALKGNGVSKMPPSGALSSCKISQFEIWVNNGYLNN
jgi:hypothetical protein